MDSAISRRVDVATLGTSMHILGVVGRPDLHQIGWDQPPMEAIEQAAIRLRPIFLENEEVFYNKIMNGLAYLAQEAPTESRQVIIEVKAAWKELTRGMYWSLAVAADAKDRDESPMRTDREIALDWLYGDLVHADPQRRDRLKNIPHHYRVLAGLLWAKDGILLTRATQQLIADLDNLGQLKRVGD